MDVGVLLWSPLGWRWSLRLAQGTGRALVEGWQVSWQLEKPVIQIIWVLHRLRCLLILAGLTYRDFLCLMGSKYPPLGRELCRAITRTADCVWKQVVGQCYCLGRWSKYVRQLRFLDGHFRGFAWMLTPRPLCSFVRLNTISIRFLCKLECLEFLPNHLALPCF